MLSMEKYIKISDIALAISLILLFYWLWNRRHFYALIFRFPGKLGLPIIGVSLELKNIDSLLPAIENEFAEQGTILSWGGTYPVILTRDPVVIEQILGSSSLLLTKAKRMYDPVRHSLEGGIFASAVSEWRTHRKLLNPVFRQNVLLSFFPIFNKGKSNMIQKFGELARANKNHEVNASGIIQKTMVIVASETILGRQREMDKGVIEYYMKCYVLVFKRLAILCLYAYLNTFSIFKYDWTYRRLNKAIKEFVEYQLNDKLKEENKNSASVNDETSHEKPQIFIDRVFDLWRKGKFSWHDVVSESNTMLIASIETTSNALFSALVMLAMHHPVQQKLYEELTTVFSGKDIDVEYEHLSKLPYLDMVVQETLRIAPSGPIVGRQITEETEIAGVRVPKGVQILICIYHLHRNKDIWGPNAHRFDPENFSPEKKEKRHPYAFIPFSKGLRNCIGYRYAMFALKVMLIGLVYNYELDTDFKFEDLEAVNYITLAYKREPTIKFKPRVQRV